MDWPNWIDANRRTLEAIGLPCDVYLTEEHWFDFLENGHLHWHPNENAGFSFDELNEGQARHLLRFLDEQISDSELEPFMMMRYTRAAPEPAQVAHAEAGLVESRELVGRPF